MKHFTTLLLAVGLTALSSLAQTVTVVTKDGKEHKFNADYLSEIRFRDAAPEPDKINFTKISDLSVYSNGNAAITMADANDTQVCKLDFYGPADASWFQQGTYQVNTVNSPFTVDPAYSEVTISGTKKKITAGNMTVASNAECVYTINVDFTLDDGSRYLGQYSGSLPSYTQKFSAVLNKAEYNVNPQAPDTYYIMFTDPDWKYSMALVFMADKSESALPAGTYTAVETLAPGGISIGKSYFDTYSPNGNFKLKAGSKVVVAKNGEDYDMTMQLLLNDGRTAEMTFKGKIGGSATFEQPVVVFDKIKVEAYSGGNATLNFTTSKDPQLALALDCYVDANATFLPVGEYNVGGSSRPYIDTNVAYSHYTYDGKNTGIKSGKMKVTRDGGVYTMEFDLVLADDTPYKGSYTGELDAFSPLIEKTLTGARYVDRRDPNKAGNFYVRFNDADWTCEATFDIFAAASAKTLPAGTYTYATTGAAGTFGANSVVDLQKPQTSNRMKEGSTIEVALNNGVYTISMNLLFEDGRICKLTFNGQISGTPDFE